MDPSVDPALTLELGREDVHFMFASMARYQFNGFLKDQKPEGHGSIEKENDEFWLLPEALVLVTADVELQVGLG